MNDLRPILTEWQIQLDTDPDGMLAEMFRFTAALVQDLNLCDCADTTHAHLLKIADLMEL